MMLTALVRASIDGAIVVAIIWAAARALRGLSPSMRAAIWWCAAAKFIVSLAWVTPIAIPVLPAATEDFPLPGIVEAVREQPAGGGRVADRPNDPFGRTIKALPALTSATALILVWAAGVFAALLIGVRGWRRTAAAVARAAPGPIDLQLMAADLARRLRLRRVPDVRVSADVDTPLVAGLLRPTILVPAGRFETLSRRQREMAVCHELAHVARGDLWLGCVPALAERLFFFHPLAHLAAREYGFWREAACDATVLGAVGAAPQEYGRLLLDLGVSRPRAGLAAAGASWSFANLKRRIVMLKPHATRTFSSRLLAVTALALSAVAVAPLRLVARPAPLALDQAAGATTAAPAAAPRPAGDAAAAVPAAPAQRTSDGVRDGELTYVLFFDAERTMMSGSGADMERARRFARRGERILWFRSGNREYLVRDPSAMREVEALWKNVHELGDRQGRVGAEQGKLGAQQGEIGARQGLLGAEQGRLGARQGELGVRQAELGLRQSQRMTDAQQRELEKDQRELELQMRELDREMRALGEKMSELGKPMEDLGAEMAILGKDMERLGRQMEAEVEKARTGMRALLGRLISDGLAELVK